jgi:hypothetical protein
MPKVAKNHLKTAKIGPNGVFRRLLDVFGVFMTKKCTKTNIFSARSVKNQEGPPTLSPKIQGGPPTLCPLPKVAVPLRPPLNRPMEREGAGEEIDKQRERERKRGNARERLNRAKT